MKLQLIALSFLALTTNAVGSSTLSCDYAKSDISKGANAPMIPGGKGTVEFDGKSFKATRPTGGVVISPIISEQKNGMLFFDDKTKVFAASLSKTEFAISDRIARITEQWANCIDVSPTLNNSDNEKPATAWKYRSLTKQEINAVEAAVKDQLKDPESARFKHSKFVSNGKGAYCGLVNSKNSYGGYAGNTPFMVMLINNGKPHAGFIGMGGDDAETLSTISVCKDNGYF
ncbi:Uncharacterised protein [Enterobacter hormaechei]|uniref:hypothetical protein n=1 Tax=Enterobacter hormaechei TaxID=158836 RepID=UPI00073594A5|nr:hypothetical protein [Enterobacter hormaechei]KTK10592.1 hypothetical protein ASU69_20420 [Enterobacter hormaechei subsp. oharae]KTK15566.1 hypothetical protein ASU68_21130 [Enterobacter hormaechei subsp. oharae]SAC89631.1 Uncharacterised protein [Enterobacter hormaechei]HAS1479150.1 hypothetical protein [Enterobacter hormaechei]